MNPDNIKILIESRKFLAKATRESNERYEKSQECAEERTDVSNQRVKTG